VPMLVVEGLGAVEVQEEAADGSPRCDDGDRRKGDRRGVPLAADELGETLGELVEVAEDHRPATERDVEGYVVVGVHVAPVNLRLVLAVAGGEAQPAPTTLD